MIKLPNFLIIGPPKCASTSLHFYLGQHPDIYVSKVKETNFFTHDYYKGLSFYSRYFADAGNAKKIGEATPSYFFLPFAMDRIKKDLPDAKLIVTLRNPVDRAFSHWLMFKEAGVEQKSFREAIEINLEQLNRVSFEGEEGAKLWDSRRYANGDEKWIRIYIQPGLYATHLERLYSMFNNDQVKVIFLEDIKSDLQQTLQSVFEFLDVDENFTIENTETKNFYFDKKYLRIVQNIAGVRGTKIISGLMPDKIKNIFKQKHNTVKNIPTLSADDRLFLEGILKDNILKTENILGRKTKGWLSQDVLFSNVSV